MSGEKGSAINIGSGRRLFIDERLIQSKTGIKLEVHKPKKTGDLCLVKEGLVSERLGGYNSVLYYDGLYRMYYTELLVYSDYVGVVVKYAQSDDGITWEKPILKLADKIDDGENNIILGMGANGADSVVGDGCCMVFIDENAPESERFKMLARLGKTELLDLLSSEDGIHWTMFQEMVLDDGRIRGGGSRFDDERFHLDSQNIIFWDKDLKKYVTYVRRNLHKSGQYRTIARCESDDLSSFPEIWEMDIVLEPDRIDRVFPRPGFPDGLPVADFYTNAAIKYPWAKEAYFMFPSLYFKYDDYLPEFKDEQPVNAGPVDIRFTASRDGINWERYDRAAFVNLGMKDDFDDSSLYMMHGMVPGKDDKIYMYYLGMDMLHGWSRGDQHHEKGNRLLTAAGLESKREISAISRLEIRMDGFVSLKGEYTGGSLTTHPLIFKGKELFVNIDTSAAGTMRIGIMDEDNCFIEGYALSDCDLVHTSNQVNRMVKWNNSSDVSSLEGKPVKLYIELYDTHLYAIQFK